jgi:beta-glucosidase
MGVTFSRRKAICLAAALLLFNLQLFAQSATTDQKIETRAHHLLEQMTLDEKIQLVHGTGFQTSPIGGASYIPGIPRLGIPDFNSADSGSGVNIEGKGVTPLPNTLALAASWDLDLASQYGTLIAKELRALGFAEGLGGGINLAREPRSGRTFEFLGEDPLLAGELIAARTRATQAQKVVATIKHFAANNQETNRFTSNSIVDERTLRELYLKGFEIGVRKGEPGNIMCAYNLVNSEKSCQNRHLLTDILKNEWGFQGVVQSDWGMAVQDTVQAANAGTDEEEPGSQDDYAVSTLGTYSYFNQRLKAAITSGEVPQSRLDDMVMRKLRVMIRLGILDNPPHPGGAIDRQAGDALALHAAEESIVLLKNSGTQQDPSAVLPLTANTTSIVVIGGHADQGVMAGGGSGNVPPRDGQAVPCLTPGAKDPFVHLLPLCATWYPSSPLAAIRAKLPSAHIEYFDGTDAIAAVAAAERADVAIVFATQFTTEQIDLKTLSLPGPEEDPANQSYRQNALITAVAAKAKKTVVILEHGTAVTMPWIAQVQAVLATWYPGVQGGPAIASVLVGETNPSGKLPLSFPKSELDLPQKEISQSDLDVVYREGLKMGYRWFDASAIEPLFPFGYGLSYTRFQYSALQVKAVSSGDILATFTLKNTGTRTGTETAQIYASLPSDAGEPPQRLVAWQRVQLAAGASGRVEVRIPASRLSVWSHGWAVPAGKFQVRVGGSSRDSASASANIELPARKLVD